MSKSMGQRMVEARNKVGMSQDDVVRALAKIGIKTSKSYISHLERGERENPNLELLNGLAKIYGVRISFLIAPEETLEALSDEEKRYFEEMIKNDKLKILLREARGLTPGDLARIIQIAKLWNEGKMPED